MFYGELYLYFYLREPHQKIHDGDSNPGLTGAPKQPSQREFSVTWSAAEHFTFQTFAEKLSNRITTDVPTKADYISTMRPSCRVSTPTMGPVHFSGIHPSHNYVTFY